MMHWMRPIAVAMAIASASVGPAQAQAGVSDPAAIAGAIGKIRERIVAAEQGGAFPRVTNAADAALFRSAFDREAIRAVPLDLEHIAPICGALSEALEALMHYASLGASDEAAADARLSAVQDEMTLMFAAGEFCGTRSLAAGERFVVALPVSQRTEARRAGTRQMQAGQLQVINALLDLQAFPQIKASNRSRIFEALLDEVDSVAAAFRLEDRAAVRAHIAKMLPGATPATRASLQRLSKAFERTDCLAFCSFASGK